MSLAPLLPRAGMHSRCTWLDLEPDTRALPSSSFRACAPSRLHMITSRLSRDATILCSRHVHRRNVRSAAGGTRPTPLHTEERGPGSAAATHRHTHPCTRAYDQLYPNQRVADREIGVAYACAHHSHKWSLGPRHDIRLSTATSSAPLSGPPRRVARAGRSPASPTTAWAHRSPVPRSWPLAECPLRTAPPGCCS